MESIYQNKLKIIGLGLYMSSIKVMVGRYGIGVITFKKV